MRLRDAIQEIDSFGIEAASNFKIRASAKAFKILSSNLYSDKILAIVRELGCNALDAHIAAGNTDQPFDVNFPTIIDPHFSIKDYGTGMSHEQVMDLYTTYFQSTKTESDDYVGALGLGSKSPFSYTDQFVVVSRVGGIRREYSAFLDESGLPSIILMNTMDTRDYEYVSLDDYSQETDTWENEGGPAWECRQLVVGSGEPDGLEVRMPCKIDDSGKFMTAAITVFSRFATKPNTNLPLRYLIREAMFQGAGWAVYGGIKRAVAVMGPVAYPIDEEHIPPNFPGVQGTIEIDFSIGSLDINAGRESLSYDAVTIENIKSRLIDVGDEIRVLIQKSIDQAPDYHEACKIALGMTVFSVDWDTAGIMYNGRQVYTDIRLDLMPNIDTYTMEKQNYHRRRYVLELTQPDRVPLYTNFYYKDCAAAKSDIVDCMNASGRLVLSGDRQALEDYIGKPIILLSKILPPKEKRIRHKISVRPFGQSYYVALDSVEHEAPLYIPTFENRPCHDNKNEDYLIKSLASSYKRCCLAKPRPIYYVPLAKVRSLPHNWKSLKQEIDDFLEECSKDTALVEYMNNKGRVILPAHWRNKYIKPNHFLYVFTAKAQHKAEYDFIIELANQSGYQIRPNISNNKSEDHESPWDRYPLLDYLVNRTYNRVPDKMVIDYIRMIDERMEVKSRIREADYVNVMTEYLGLDEPLNAHKES